MGFRRETPDMQHNLALSIIKPPLDAAGSALDLVSLAGVNPQISLGHPSTMAQAQASPHWPKWEEAINIELDSLTNAGTWAIVDLPPDRKPISAKWVFKTKQDAANNISKFKARLVACGYSQVHGVDYHATYSLVVSMTCLRMVMSYGIKHGYRIHQLDFVAAYLNGELKDVDFYMVLPPGFKERFKQTPQSVCNLKKALYGLKQSGREWYSKLDHCLTAMGFAQLGRDMAMYKMGSVVVAVYVDDLIIVGVDSDVDHIIATIQVSQGRLASARECAK
ncbi:hypothetical protein NDA18_000057 [Ustilago nuda]|nr:hypothetical protein NDA18_000057 [Ustilago nuda]